MVKLVLDAGHSLKTPGKRTPDGEHEWSFNNQQLLACERYLQRYEGVKIIRVDDPTGKRDIPLKERTDKSNAFGADAYVSFHNNALSFEWDNHEGMETFSYIGRNPKSEKLQRAIHKHLIKATKNKNRGMKEADFHVLRETKNCAAVLCESFFMDSRTDIKKLRDKQYLKATGEAIAKGIVECYGLKKKPKPKKLYKVQIGAFGNRDNAEKLAKSAESKGFKTFIIEE
ncbi:N-acetylmuramoyl-L-alanine amidase [Bacillus sp. 2205SS5-2]|uniref:N-acetylmuramoyl-L-alanine amidase n=1 Tax=Bacillus sp. 2205SS5-2 TaxID=3109031 RepID=UPI003006D9FF